MAEEQTTPQQQEQEAQRNGCPGNCMECQNEQRLYCASQIGYNTMILIGSLQERIRRMQEVQELMQGMVAQLTEHIASMGQPSDKKPELFAAPEPQDAMQPETIKHTSNKEEPTKDEVVQGRKKPVSKK